jgi:hypothetical protein
VLALLNQRPAILVYTRKATFQLWSGVLDLGGYEMTVEPFSGEELQGAVLRAAKSFEEQPPNDSRRDHSRCRDRRRLQKQKMEESWRRFQDTSAEAGFLDLADVGGVHPFGFWVRLMRAPIRVLSVDDSPLIREGRDYLRPCKSLNIEKFEANARDTLLP